MGSRVARILLLLFAISLSFPQLLMAAPASGPKRIILLVGDGMGFEALGLLHQYARLVAVKPSRWEEALARGELALMQPLPHGALVTDSACSITELASGVSALPETLGIDATGKPVVTIAEKARHTGLSVGLISDTRLTHATPAGFAAKVKHRSDENEIAEQMLASQFELLLSGGLQHFMPAGVNFKSLRPAKRYALRMPPGSALRSSRKDNKDLLETALDSGYRVALSRQELEAQEKLPVLGLFAPSGMQNALDEKFEKNPSQPSLAQMTKKGLELLETDPQGFFLMVEAGQIDWAEHANDAGLLLHEMRRFDATLGVLLDWIAKHPETVLVVTADHDTGGFGFSYTVRDIPAPMPFKNSPASLYSPQHNFGSIATLRRLSQQEVSVADFLKEYNSSGNQPTDAQTLRSNSERRLALPLSPTALEKLLHPGSNLFLDPAVQSPTIEPSCNLADASTFYSNPSDRRTALFARLTAEETGIVWSTGSHTSAPVPFLVIGKQAPRGLVSGSEAGQFMLSLLSAD